MISVGLPRSASMHSKVHMSVAVHGIAAKGLEVNGTEPAELQYRAQSYSYVHHCV